MAVCRNHDSREAPHVCSGCSGPFCDACVVRFEKLLFCEACKARYLAGVDEGPRSADRAAGPPTSRAAGRESRKQAQRARDAGAGAPR